VSELDHDISTSQASSINRVTANTGDPTTLVEVFQKVARTHKRPDTINYKKNGVWVPVSSDELLTRAQHVAAGLYSLGLRYGDRLALLSDSRVEWTLTDAGCIFAGIVDVPIYPTLTPSQVCYIINDSGATCLVLANREQYDDLREILSQTPNIKQIIIFDEAGVTSNDGLTLSQLEARGAALEKEQPQLITELAQRTTPGDLATIIYTSGTTGEPKGVMLTHSNLVSNLIDSSGHLSFSEKDTALSVLPLSHVFERQAMYMYLHQGMAVYFAESLQTIGPNLREVKPTILIGVPRIFEKIYDRIRERATEAGKLTLLILDWAVEVSREYAKYTLAHRPVPLFLKLKHSIASRLVFSRWHAAFGGRIRLLVSGGAALPEDLASIYIGAGISIIQGYGLTETSPVITASQIEDMRVGTVGRAIPNVEIRIASDGEIETRGPNVMRGYYNKPAETKAVFTEDGWFKTGDIGNIDADGCLRITDRKKELFKTSGGKYISPQPIEQAIKASRFVSQVVLIGNERKFPAALVVPMWEQLESYCKVKGIAFTSRSELCHNPTIIDLIQRQIDKLTPNLAKYERVKKVALLEDELTVEGGELTPTLKVKRRVVDSKYKNVIDKIYASAD
jgi:long-chain acyl-CoA synthetase